jgi:hypothetical protein
MAELNGWNYNTTSLALASSLSERARSILAELDDNKCRDFNNLVKVLRSRYGSVNRSELFKAELQGKVRGRNETIPELVECIKKLARKAYTNIGPEVADSLAIDYFIDAIPESDIRLRLIEVEPKTMSEAENLAVKLETLRVADKQRGKPVRNIDQSLSQNDENIVDSRISKLEQTINCLGILDKMKLIEIKILGLVQVHAKTLGHKGAITPMKVNQTRKDTKMVQGRKTTRRRVRGLESDNRAQKVQGFKS